MVKDLCSQVSQLQGTDHQRRYNDLKAELKAYCMALDFNGTSAVTKLRSLIDEATLTTKISWSPSRRGSPIPKERKLPRCSFRSIQHLGYARRNQG